MIGQEMTRIVTRVAGRALTQSGGQRMARNSRLSDSSEDMTVMEPDRIHYPRLSVVVATCKHQRAHGPPMFAIQAADVWRSLQLTPVRQKGHSVPLNRFTRWTLSQPEAHGSS